MKLKLGKVHILAHMKSLINKIKFKIRKSIYLELTTGVFCALIVSIFVFQLSYNVFKNQGKFRKVHISYERSKYDTMDTFENVTALRLSRFFNNFKSIGLSDLSFLLFDLIFVMLSSSKFFIY